MKRKETRNPVTRAHPHLVVELHPYHVTCISTGWVRAWLPIAHSPYIRQTGNPCDYYHTRIRPVPPSLSGNWGGTLKAEAKGFRVFRQFEGVATWT